MPLTVAEYQVAQLYMIMKKSREESDSPGARVEILENRPYTDGPEGTNGQYTKKHFHVGERLPRWATSLITKPVLEEEAWNAYPYTKTQYTCFQAPSMIKDNLSLSIESKYLNDIGNSENVFNLDSNQLRQRKVYHLDMVNDYNDVYIEAEDPLAFKSAKTGRGPLTKTWIKDRDGSKDILCAYKLCRIRFDNYFFGQKVEQDLIHERALKKMFIHAHRQAWCWQDEYHGLTMEDIRRLEAEAAKELAQRFASAPNANSSPSSKAATPKLASKSSQKTKSKKAIPLEEDFDVIEHEEGDEDEEAESPSAKFKRSEAIRVNDEIKVQTEVTGKDHLAVTHGENAQHKSSPISITTPEKQQHEERDDESGIFRSPLPNHRHNSPNHVTPTNDVMNDDSDPNSNLPFVTPTLSANRNKTNYRQTVSSNSRLSVDSDSGSDIFVSDPEGDDDDLSKLGSARRRMSRNGTCSIDNADDEFFDAVSQHMYSSTMALDFNEDDQPSYNASLAMSENRDGSCCSSSEGASKNVVFLLAGDCLFRRDKTNFSDYQQSFQENISKISQRFFQNSLSSTIVKSVLIQNSLIEELRGALNDISCEGGVETSERTERFYTVNDSETHNSSSASFGSRVPLTTAALFITRQANYSKALQALCSELNDMAADLQQQFGDHTELDFSVVCDNLASVLFHDLVANFSVGTNANTKTSSSNLPSNVVTPKLNFDLLHVYYLGSSLGFVLSFFNAKNNQSFDFRLYNIFFAEDGNASRVEPVLSANTFSDKPFKLAAFQDLFRRGSERTQKIDIFPDVRGRVDFQLSAGHNVEDRSFMELVTKVRGSHALYWESFDVAFFILSNFGTFAMFSHPINSNMIGTGGAAMTGNPGDPDDVASTVTRRKFGHKSSARKAKNFPPVHVIDDMSIICGRGNLTIKGRFGYRVGVFVSKLSKENIEFQIRRELELASEDEWKTIGSAFTGSRGRVSFRYPDAACLKVGLYSVRAICPGDLSVARATLCILPPKGVQAVVFSIDGTFADSVSITGSNSKLRQNSVELVKFWAALGYLVVYASARPSVMKQVVSSWLDVHGFPHSVCFFVEGLHTPDKSMSLKLRMLENFSQLCNVSFYAAYGSQKDVSMYSTLGVEPERTFIFPDRMTSSSKQSLSSQYVTIPRNGIPTHLAELKMTSQELTAEAPLNFAMQSTRRIISSSQKFSASQLSHSLQRSYSRNLAVNASTEWSTNGGNQFVRNQPSSSSRISRIRETLAGSRKGPSTDATILSHRGTNRDRETITRDKKSYTVDSVISKTGNTNSSF